MNEYQVRWQTQEMYENDEWGTYYYEHWKDATEIAWEMKCDPEIIVVQVREISTTTFKDETED